MMQPPRHFSRRGRELDVTMTPMIDVVFLLLIFFVWTAGFHAVELLVPGQSVQMAGSSESAEFDLEQVDFDQLVVRLLWQDQQPRWVINDRSRASLAEVRQTLEEVARVKGDLPVIVDPDAAVPLAHVIAVYDAA